MSNSVAGLQPTVVAGAVLCVAIGLATASYGGYDYIKQTESVRVDATVTERSIETNSETSSNPGLEYEPTVAFEYIHNGTEYTGTKPFPAEVKRDYKTRSAAESAAAEYEPGARTTAYLDPEEPGDAFSKNETSNAPLIALGIGGILSPFAAASAAKRSDRSRTQPRVPLIRP